MKKFLTSWCDPWITVFADDDGTGTQTAEEKAEEERKAKEAEGAGDDDKPTISQKKLNHLLAEEKRKYQKQVEGQVKELEKLKQIKGITDKEKTDLQQRIEDLNNSMLSKEELASKEREKMSGEHKRQVEGLTTERDTWQRRYTEASITRSITDEAVKAEAFSPSQLVALLQPLTRLAEDLDDDGKPTGSYTPKVKLLDKDKDGKPVTLDLTVGEAVKRMKDRTDDFGNLFKSGVAGGLGSNSGAGTGTSTDATKPPSDPAKYREWRKKHLPRS